jgi:hypothetical protein
MEPISISCYTRRGHHLDPKTAPTLLAAAAAIIETVAHRMDWTDVGRDHMPGLAQEGTEEPGVFVDHERMVTSRLFSLNDGAGNVLALDLIDDTGIMPFRGIVTSRSLNRLLTHAAIIHVLDRLNRDVFGGRLVIDDTAGYYPTFDAFELAHAFHGSADDALTLIRELHDRAFIDIDSAA